MTEQISQKQQLILDQIVPIIAGKLGVDPAEIKMVSHFANDLGADSLDQVELMMDFEKMLHLSIPDDKQEVIQTVGDVVRLVDSMDGKLRPGTAKNAVISKTATVPTKTATKVPDTPRKKSETVKQTKKTATVKPKEKTSPQDLLEMKVKEVFEMPMGDVIRLMMQLRQIQK